MINLRYILEKIYLSLGFERVNGIEPSSSAWKADALAIMLYPQVWDLKDY